MIDKDNKTALKTLTDLNNALNKLVPQITGISSDMLSVKGFNLNILNAAIANSNFHLYDKMTRSEVLTELNTALPALVNSYPINYIYDTHGDKHFTGAGGASRFTSPAAVVNPKLVSIIASDLGSIRRDAAGSNQTYYYTGDAIPECGAIKSLTIQIDYCFSPESITYHGYPDAGVITNTLSRTKNGTAIAS